MTILTTLDVLIIVSTLVIAGAGVYLILIMRRLSHMMKVADRFALTLEKLQDALSVLDRIPTNMVRRITERFTKKK